jgi:Methyltransferase domain
MLNRELFAVIGARAWELPEVVRRVPTMLTPEEQRMLVWIAEHRPHPEAAVCDLGSFLGGSTVSLAQGIRSSRQLATLHAYDRFTIDVRKKEEYLYSKGYRHFPGPNTFHIVRDHVAPFADFVVLHPGDIVEQHWIGDPISVLFIDISKSWQTNDVILREFFPYLQAGSVVIQQDYFIAQNPWLHVTMHKLRHKIDYAGATERNSAIYMVREPLTDTDIEGCLRRNTPNSDVFAAIDAVLDQFQDDPVHLRVLLRLKKNYQMVPDALNAWQFTALGRAQ